MTIRLLRALSIDGRDYGRMDLVVGLSAAQETALVRGGDAEVVAATDLPPSFALSQNDVTAMKAAVSEDGIADPTNGQPFVTRGGTPISYRSNGMSVVASGGYLTGSAGTGQRAWYATRNYPTGCKRLGCEFKFTAGSGGRNGTVALALGTTSVAASNNVPAMPVHFTVTRWGWSVGTSPNVNGVITNYASGRFNAALSAGTRYTVEFSLDGGVLYIRLPDGTTATATDAALTSMVGTDPFWEVYQYDATDDMAAIGRVWMSAGDQALDGGAAWLASQLAIPAKVKAKQLTSIVTAAIGTTVALVDAAATCPVNTGPAGANDVLCRFGFWVSGLPAGKSVILAPKFVDIDGGVIAQPYMFAFTAATWADAAGTIAARPYSGPVSCEFVQTLASTKPFSCELWALADASGASFSVAANKPITMSFVPLG